MNNAGIAVMAPIDDYLVEHFDRMLVVNPDQPLHLTNPDDKAGV